MRLKMSPELKEAKKYLPKVFQYQNSVMTGRKFTVFYSPSGWFITYNVFTKTHVKGPFGKTKCCNMAKSMALESASY